MTDNIADLAGRRALVRLDSAKNPKEVTVADCLRAALHLIETGEFKADMVYVALATREDDDGDQTLASLNTGGSAFEIIGLLSQHMHDFARQ